jgi:hypothetical protein
VKSSSGQGHRHQYRNKSVFHLRESLFWGMTYKKLSISTNHPQCPRRLLFSHYGVWSSPGSVDTEQDWIQDTKSTRDSSEGHIPCSSSHPGGGAQSGKPGTCIWVYALTSSVSL